LGLHLTLSADETTLLRIAREKTSGGRWSV
jgi:hypothetical protein